MFRTRLTKQYKIEYKIVLHEHFSIMKKKIYKS